jgi:hypothetical protein
MAAAAPPDMNGKAPDDGLHRRQILLILRRDLRFRDRLATRRTLGGQRHLVGLVHDGRNRPLATSAIPGARLATRSARLALRRPLREGSRLPRSRTPRRFQLIFQPRVFPLKPRPLTFDAVAFGLRPRQLFAQPAELLALLLDQFGRFRIARTRHAPVMLEFSRQYKSDPVTS